MDGGSVGGGIEFVGRESGGVSDSYRVGSSAP